jgi:hypothetical protein
MAVENIIDQFPKEEDLIKQIMHISATVWRHELTGKDIDNWLSNFTGQVFSQEEEKIIALWLLTHFVYYNEDEVRHLCKVLYRDFIHSLIEKNKVQDSDIESFISTNVANCTFHHMGQGSESGAYVLYYFRQQNDLALINFPKFLNIEEELPENIVFIDDVTLTGDETSQAYIFFKKLKVKGNKKMLLTFVASAQAIKSLAEIGVTVISAITLDNRNKCFDRESEIFMHHSNLLDTCRQMMSHYGKILFPKGPLGYKNGQYTFGFFYNTPDNSLPIFWSETNNWIPIVKRYEKKYKAKFFEYERFV